MTENQGTPENEMEIPPERRISSDQERAMWLTKDRLRMVQWLVAAVVLYALAMMVTQPQIQVALWKSGNVTFAAWLGYQIDRQAYPYERCREGSHHCQLRRAIIVVGAMLAIGLGL